MSYMLHVEDLQLINQTEKILEEQLTISIDRFTIQAILRELRGEPHLDILVREPVSKEKQVRIKETALENFVAAVEKASKTSS